MKPGYTEHQVEFLREGYQRLQIPELTEAFNARFDLNKPETAIKSALSNRGITCGRPSGNPKGTFISYTREQADFIIREYPNQDLQTLTRSFNEVFGAQKTVAQLRAFTRNHRVRSGRTGQFESEHKPWNTGTKGLTSANKTSFKKGQVPKTIKPVGHERICSKDGYVLVKTGEKNPYTGAVGWYRHKHQVVWEQAHGPIPGNCVVSFIDGDRQNCELENLRLLTRAENLYLNRNGYSEMPEELRPSMRVLAKLEVKRFERQKAMRGEDR